jgi:uncharacterized protein YdeI (BOF family)
MKSLRQTMLVLLLCLTTAAGYSQATSTQQTKIFANFADEISLSVNTLKDAFNATDGQSVSLQLSSSFNFSGTVISNMVKYHNLRSIVIKSPLFNDAIFHLSQITNEDNTITYVGRIINDKAFDGYQIKRDAAGNYSFQKFETKRLLQDCSL